MNMEEKEDKKGGFFSNWIVRNVLLAVLFFAVLIFVSSMLLSVLTNHGKTIEVPDFTSMTPSTPRMPRRSACRILSAIQCVKPRQN